jgi:secretion/DNA translocation related TadE-like protein
MSRDLRPRRVESGSGTIWVLAMALVLVVGGVVAATVASVAGAGRRADTAADLAALSAAARLTTTPESSCRVARQVVDAHEARLVACSVTGDQVDVAVEVDIRGLGGGLFVVRSRARADPGS